MDSNIEISPYGSLLVFKKGYTPEFVKKIVREKKLKGLRVFGYFEERLSNLDFLEEYKFLEALDITTLDEYDYTFLSKLTNLKQLSISNEGSNSIDLTNLINLTELSIRWRKGRILGLEKCSKLNALCLVNFNEKDFLQISQLLKLNKLEVKTASVESTRGLEKLIHLESLLLGNCQKLKSIVDIDGLAKLSSIDIEACPKIEDYECLKDMNALKDLSIVNCKGIKSIKFINNFDALKKLSLLGNTDVLDGDMTPAKRIDKVFYQHRLHFSPCWCCHQQVRFLALVSVCYQPGVSIQLGLKPGVLVSMSNQPCKLRTSTPPTRLRCILARGIGRRCCRSKQAVCY
jgi:hypothetical protein